MNKEKSAKTSETQIPEESDLEVARLENVLGSLDVRDRLLKKHTHYISHYLAERFDDQIMGDKHWIETMAIGAYLSLFINSMPYTLTKNCKDQGPGP